MPAPRSPHGRRRPVVPVAVAGLLAIALSGCGGREEPSTTPRPPTAGLVILAGEPRAATLTIHDAGGRVREVPLPGRATAWISASPNGTLVATLDDGTVHVTGVLEPAAAPAWRPAVRGDAGLPEAPVYFATWAPDGSRVAAIDADFNADDPFRIAVADPAAPAGVLVPVPRSPLVAPPTWLDERRLIVQTDEGLVLVDVGSGALTEGPRVDLAGGVALDVSADSGLIAIARADAGGVDVHRVNEWLVAPAAGAVTSLTGQGEVGAVAWDETGGRLAVVWQQPDGPGTLTVYRAAEGWAEVARLTLPGESARAAVDWLP
jgi:hypothetical protein